MPPDPVISEGGEASSFSGGSDSSEDSSSDDSDSDSSDSDDSDDSGGEEDSVPLPLFSSLFPLHFVVPEALRVLQFLIGLHTSHDCAGLAIFLIFAV
jgi:hypothetical protein